MNLSPNTNEILIKDLLKKQKELEDSLKYASYIQASLLPKINEIQYVFPDSFIFFKPKDIVSGDFYYINRSSKRTILVLGDSTGHGVPGAFLSILGISFLDLVISKYNPKSASGILNYLREYLMKALDQTGKENEQKDGMDMALCIIDRESNRLQYAGAFNPLYIVRDKKLHQILGDKMPVGVSAEMEHSFKNNIFSLEKNDYIYMFSDGFPDQFGGEDEKKYKYKKFRELLIKSSQLAATEQPQMLENEFENWKGEQAQVDDVTILGVKYNN